MTTPFAWLDSGVDDSPPFALWEDAQKRSWLPSSERIVIHVFDPAGGALVRKAVTSLIDFLRQVSTPPSIEIIDKHASQNDYPRARLLDLDRAPRHVVAAACAPEGAHVPSLWFRDFTLVTIAAAAPTPQWGVRGLLAAQAALIEVPCSLDLARAFAAHQLMPSSLGIVCGFRRFADRQSGCWWAIGPHDVTVERAIAAAAGAAADSLPIFQYLARHELLRACDVAGLPKLVGYLPPPYRIVTARAAAKVAALGRRASKDLTLAFRNLRRVPAFLQRRFSFRMSPRGQT